MACPFCPVSSALGGFFGSWFSINPPRTRCTKILSVVLTSTATAATAVALKVFFNISLCKGDYTLPRISLIIVGATIVGTIYSIGINYLLNKFIEPKDDCNLNNKPKSLP